MTFCDNTPPKLPGIVIPVGHEEHYFLSFSELRDIQKEMLTTGLEKGTSYRYVDAILSAICTGRLVTPDK